MTKYINKNTLLIFCLCCILALVPALKGDTRDTAIYISVFQDITYFPYDLVAFYTQYQMDWGYGLLAWFIGAWGLGYKTLFFGISLLTFMSLWHASKNFEINFFDVLPFYLSSFFLLQQLMQIRQGLAMALAYLAFSYVTADANHRKFYVFGIPSLLMHISSLPLLAVSYLSIYLKKISKKKWTFILITLLITSVMLFFIKYIYESDLFLEIEKLKNFKTDDEYGYDRGVFALANIRALFILILITLTAKPTLFFLKTFRGLYLLLMIGVIFRIIFSDFAIISGRIGVTFSFAEVFIIPLYLNHQIKSRILRSCIAMVYFIAQGYVTLVYQAPYLIDDYFTYG